MTFWDGSETGWHWGRYLEVRQLFGFWYGASLLGATALMFLAVGLLRLFVPEPSVPKEVVLSCGGGRPNGLVLATGAVARSPPAETDLRCTVGSRLELVAANAAPASEDAPCATSAVDRLRDVTADCVTTSIPCGDVTPAGYWPSCTGVGARVSDRAGREYLLRVISDDVDPDDRVGVIVVEYIPAP